MRASQFYEDVDVSGLILVTITELEIRKQEDNKRFTIRLERTKLCLMFIYCLKTAAPFKVRYVNIGYSIGKALGGCDTNQLEIVIVKRSGRWDIIIAYPCS